MENIKQKIDKVGSYLYPIFLFLFPLRHIRYGAEWWDTGYNYANFTYMDQMDPMWFFSTFFSNILGNIFTKLPLGNYMIGLNLYTGLLVSLLACMGYFFFVKIVKLPKGIVFLGEFLAICFCWCPTALLYNYLTYLLMASAVIMLYQGIIKADCKSKFYYIVAGILLGVNVFVRFSNLAQMALIVAVWAMALIRKENFKKVFINTFYCIVGYLIGCVVVFLGISLIYGGNNFIDGILRLLNMPSEASDYTLVSMVEQQIRNYIQNLKWMRYPMVYLVLGTFVYGILPKKFELVKKIGYVCACFAGFYLLYIKQMYNFNYATQMSVFQWAVTTLTATMIISIIVIFHKRFTDREKLLSGLSIIIIVITPLGSNNHLFGSINNLFLVLPITLWMGYRFCKWLPYELQLKNKIQIPLYPTKAMILALLAMIIIQGTGFGLVYVFSEANGGVHLNTKVENNQVLTGMLTSPERAQVISSLSEFIQIENLKGKEVIVYGNIPSLPYYLELPFAMTPWPDLASYNYSVMKEDLGKIQKQVEEKEREYPLILLEQNVVLNSTVEGSKVELLEEFIIKNNYEKIFANEKFVLYQSIK